MPEKPVYLTREGYERLERELRELRTVRRPAVAERIRRAKEFTDTVDNAEYDDAKQDQAFIEGRIQDLERMLATAVIIDEHPAADAVRLGSHVMVEDEDGETQEYMIVGSAEADPRQGRISNESPVGRALLGRRAGDEVLVNAPGGSFRLRIKEIR
ncbi:MAG TPA: transcription elongation factor GreA [Chloroflexota bacterium]|jgi:transcription elongation factor GreA|nr:transcription elongation factor GreA [Chloroflexota bacterium]HZU05364.1 transcription elongation factor GreA [Chloroflexota bacterium]